MNLWIGVSVQVAFNGRLEIESSRRVIRGLSGARWALLLAALGLGGINFAAETASIVSADKAVLTNPPSENVSAAPTGSTNTEASNSARRPDPFDYSTFRMVAERNIFNTQRSPIGTNTSGSGEPRTFQVNTISHVGFLGSAKGDRAFFDGSSLSYRKAITIGESLDIFKLTSISPEGAVLEAPGGRFSLKIGDQIRQENEGEWKLTDSRQLSQASDSVGSPITESASAAGDSPNTETIRKTDDVPKRLQKKKRKKQ